MKPGLFLSVLMLIAIIVASSFGLSLMPTDPLYDIPDSVAANALYVCPAADNIFSPVAKILIPMRGILVIVFFFFVMIMFAMYAWGLYKNLLSDKFNADEYKSAWFLLKTLFWATIIVSILLHTPNSFRAVHLRGINGDFILCDDNTPGARPVRANTVTPGFQK